MSRTLPAKTRSARAAGRGGTVSVGAPGIARARNAVVRSA